MAVATRRLLGQAPSSGDENIPAVAGVTPGHNASKGITKIDQRFTKIDNTSCLGGVILGLADD
ncbi:MAG: hypothetical protein ACP5VQ_06835 [Phycisphaerae bacterium]